MMAGKIGLDIVSMVGKSLLGGTAAKGGSSVASSLLGALGNAVGGGQGSGKGGGKGGKGGGSSSLLDALGSALTGGGQGGSAGQGGSGSQGGARGGKGRSGQTGGQGSGQGGGRSGGQGGGQGGRKGGSNEKAAPLEEALTALLRRYVPAGSQPAQPVQAAQTVQAEQSVVTPVEAPVQASDRTDVQAPIQASAPVTEGRQDGNCSTESADVQAGQQAAVPPQAEAEDSVAQDVPAQEAVAADPRREEALRALLACISSFTDGRVRVRHEAFCEPSIHAPLQQALLQSGMFSAVEFKALTGSVLLQYDADQLSREDFLEAALPLGLFLAALD